MKKKSRKEKPRLKFRIFRALFAFIVIVIITALFLMLPIFEIKEVVVNGAKMLSPEEVKGLAGIPLNENLFYTSLARARANLSKITAIKEVKFYRIPPATILISIQEREPIAAVVLPQKSLIIDCDGYILNRNQNVTLSIPKMASLPVIFGLSGKVLKEEALDKEFSETIHQVIISLERFIAPERIRVEIKEENDMTLILDDLLRVKVGNTDNISRKMEVLGSLLKVVAGKWAQVEYVDVRFSENPVIRYK